MPKHMISKFAPKNNRFPEPKGTTTFLVSWMNLRQGCPGAHPLSYSRCYCEIFVI